MSALQEEIAEPNWQRIVPQMAVMAVLLAGLLFFCTCTPRGRDFSGYAQKVNPGDAVELSTVPIPVGTSLSEHMKVQVNALIGTRWGDCLQTWVGDTETCSVCVGSRLLTGQEHDAAVYCNLSRVQDPALVFLVISRGGRMVRKVPVCEIVANPRPTSLADRLVSQ